MLNERQWYMIYVPLFILAMYTAIMVVISNEFCNVVDFGKMFFPVRLFTNVMDTKI